MAGADAYAAKFCNDFVFAGFHDWFLPSNGELYQLKANLPFNAINIYPGDLYWSSSEVAFPTYEWAAWFVTVNGIASFSSDDKDTDHGIIPVRKF